MHTTNKKHREWEELVRATGCCVTGATNDVQIHHVVGRKGKHNKVLIGPYFILPLHKDYHMVTGAHPNAWHKNKRGFIEEFGDPRDLWNCVQAGIYAEELDRFFKRDPKARDHREELGVTVDVGKAIMDYPI